MISLAEVRGEVLRGSAALWIGAHGPSGATPSSSAVANVSWTAIWSEPTSLGLANSLRKAWAAHPLLRSRSIVEVPGRRADSLGSFFSYAELCPFFYLNGTAAAAPKLSSRERRRARDEHVDAMMSLGRSMVIVCGYRRAEELLTLLSEELLHDVYATRFLVCDLLGPELEQLEEGLASLPSRVAERVAIAPENLDTLLAKIFEGADQVEGPTVQVQQRSVSVAALVARDKPIDSEFILLTEETVASPKTEEDKETLLRDLMLSRGLPFRAFAHGLHWQRPFTVAESIQRLARELSAVRGARVGLVDVPAESGSGLTVALRLSAFACARLGLPTLILRPEVRQLDFDLLRLWFDTLAPEGVQEPGAGRPVFVMVLDDYDAVMEGSSGIRELPTWILRQGRAVIIVRGLRVDSVDRRDSSERLPLRGVEDGACLRLPRLRAELEAGERPSLLAWAERTWPGSGANLEAAVNGWALGWKSGGMGVPLLVALYSIVRGRVTTPQDVARTLLQRVAEVARQLPEHRVESGDHAPDVRASARLSGDQLANAVARLRMRVDGVGVPPPRVVSDSEGLRRSEFMNGLVALCVCSTLRLGMPRALLRHFAGMSENALAEFTDILGEAEVGTVSFSADVEFGVHGRRASYSRGEQLCVAHPGIARIIMHALLDGRGVDAVHESCPLLIELTAQAGEEEGERGGVLLGDFPTWLLAPLLRRLHPTADHIEFAREVSGTFLRLQRIRDSAYHRWLWAGGRNRRQDLLSLFRMIPEAVARQSSVILHSRAITQYKLCDRARGRAACVELYSAASEDLSLAVDVAASEQGSGEQPGYLVTSLGRLLLGWAQNEEVWVAEAGGTLERARQLRAEAMRRFREGMQLIRVNPYAFAGVAELLLDECDQGKAAAGRGADTTTVGSRLGEALGEALQLLEGEPEANFREEWEGLRLRAIQMLSDAQIRHILSTLRTGGHEIAAALDALGLIGGAVPRDALPEGRGAVDARAALAMLTAAAQTARYRSPLAALLRYAIFSALPERVADPAYDRRLELLKELAGTRYLEEPIWMFDRALVLAQGGHYAEADAAFAELRRGKRFLEVPIDRARWLSAPHAPMSPLLARLRVFGAAGEGKGWAKVEDPKGFIARVPFWVRAFHQANGPVVDGSVRIANIKVLPAGYFAEPFSPKRDGRG